MGSNDYVTGHINSLFVGDFPPQNFVSSGWQCPVCLKVYAPSMAMCVTDHGVPNITISGHTNPPKEAEGK